MDKLCLKAFSKDFLGKVPSLLLGAAKEDDGEPSSVCFPLNTLRLLELELGDGIGRM